MYQERQRLENQTAVVTGGGRGIGLCCAEAPPSSGARIVLVERDEELGRGQGRHSRRKATTPSFVGA